jgi:transcription elongation GreA/GreB family factor
VPDGVLGCQYCESGRPAAVKLRQPIAARRPGAETNPEAATPVPAPGSAQPGTVVGAVDLVTGEMHRWSLIMPYQGRPHHGGLSSASPIGKALIGHVVGDIIEVNVPRGIRRLKLIDVSTEHA